MRLTVFLRFPRFGFNLRHGVTSRNRSILEDTSSQFVPVNGAGLRSMVQDGWRSGTVVALATGIDPSPLVLLSFSSLLCHILLVSLSLSALSLPLSISISLSFLPLQCRTHRYRCIHRFQRHREEKNLFSYPVFACCIASSFLSGFLILVNFESSVDLFLILFEVERERKRLIEENKGDAQEKAIL